MLIPRLELETLYQHAIDQVAWERTRPLPQASPHRGGFSFEKNRYQFILTFDALISPEVMSLQVSIPFVGDGAGLRQAREIALRLNREVVGVKFMLNEAGTPTLICAVEAILASHRRIPNSEVVEAVLRSSLQRLEEAVETAESALRTGSR